MLPWFRLHDQRECSGCRRGLWEQCPYALWARGHQAQRRFGQVVAPARMA